MLFGKDCTVQQAFNLLDKDGNGEVSWRTKPRDTCSRSLAYYIIQTKILNLFWISFQINFNELINFIQGTGISLQQRFLGYQRRDINGIFEFFDTLQNALLTNVKRAFVNVSTILFSNLNGICTVSLSVA
jgi:hypothetical protein